jgi:hypothetical protein
MRQMQEGKPTKLKICGPTDTKRTSEQAEHEVLTQNEPVGHHVPFGCSNTTLTHYKTVEQLKRLLKKEDFLLSRQFKDCVYDILQQPEFGRWEYSGFSRAVRSRALSSR